MKKLLSRTYCILMVLIMLYGAVCYFDIISKNTSPDPEYKSWNVIVSGIRWMDAHH